MIAASAADAADDDDALVGCRVWNVRFRLPHSRRSHSRRRIWDSGDRIESGINEMMKADWSGEEIRI